MSAGMVDSWRFGYAGREIRFLVLQHLGSDPESHLANLGGLPDERCAGYFYTTDPANCRVGLR